MGVEKACWNLFTKGDKKSFELLYDLYYTSLLSYATKFSKDVLLIEESVQDLFVKLWQNRANLKQPDNIKYYLFKALRNTIFNKLNQVKKEVYVGDESDMLAFDLQVDISSPQDGLEHWDYLSKKLMPFLTDRQKEAVYLFYVEDMSYQEISDLLKIRIGGTYKLLYRAMAGIKAQAKEFEKDDRLLHKKERLLI